MDFLFDFFTKSRLIQFFSNNSVLKELCKTINLRVYLLIILNFRENKDEECAQLDVVQLQQIVKSPRIVQGVESLNKIGQIQGQLSEFVTEIKINLDKIIERDEKLHNLEARSNSLQNMSKPFQKETKRIETKFWWKNTKVSINNI